MARKFNGTNQSVTVGTTNLPTTGDSTTIALVKLDVTAAQQTIFIYGTSGGSTTGWSIGTGGTGTRVWRFAKVTGPNVDTVNLLYAPGKWYAFAAKHQTTTNVKFFLRALGEAKAATETIAETTGIVTPTNAAYIGQRTGSDRWLNGPVSAVAVYSKALTDPLIEYIIDGFVTGQVWRARQNGLVGFWQLSGVGTEKDWSGSANHSTAATGMPAPDPYVARRIKWMAAPAAAFKSAWAQNSNIVIQQGGVFGAP